MSELKEHLFCECDECIREYRGPLSNEMRPYYLKSEADKVIAEKDKEIAELKADYKEACDRLQTANLIKDEQLAETRHQKYKRCLYMAEICRAKRDEIIARTPTLILNHPTEYLTRWENRWLELAEKFKEKK